MSFEGPLRSQGVRTCLDSLPNELLCLIIEFGYHEPKRAPDGTFRATTMLTSRRLRDVILQTPSIWSVIVLHKPKEDPKELSRLATNLARSGDWPLEIYLKARWWDVETTGKVMEYLLPHATRWRRLSYKFTEELIFSYIRSAPLRRLESLDISYYSEFGTVLSNPIFDALPQRLVHLGFRNIDFSGLVVPFQNLKSLELRGRRTTSDFTRVIEVLRHTPLLESLILYLPHALRVHALASDGLRSGSSKVHLPELRHLELYMLDWVPDGSINILHTFFMPQLYSLILREGRDALAGRSKIVMSYTTNRHANHSPEDILLFHPPSQDTMSGLCKRFFVQERPNNADSTLDMVLGALPPNVIRSIESLVLDYSALTQSHGRYHQEVKSLQALPSLTSLSVKAVSSQQWRSIAEVFGGGPYDYPRPTSLEISGATDLFPIVPGHRDYVDLSKRFPQLRCLKLDSVNTNAFVKQLLPSPPTGEATYLVFPNFEALLISNDMNVSKPLLYRMMRLRENAGKPLKKLLLDRHFSANKESWDYIKTLVDVSEI